METNRAKMLQVRSSEAELDMLDRYAADEARNRSEAVREIIRATLLKKGYLITPNNHIIKKEI